MRRRSDVRHQYEAKKAADARRAQENQPQPWWWLGQGDPIARFTKWLVIYTFGLVIATVGSAIILYKTDHTLQRTVTATQRPWVGTEIVTKGAFHFLKDGYALAEFELTLKNYGNSVATAFGYRSHMFGDPGADANIRIKAQRVTCEGATKSSNSDELKSNGALFPTGEMKWFIGETIIPSEI
jgi:hypothetical protein